MNGDWVSGPPTSRGRARRQPPRLLRGLLEPIRSRATSTGARACPTGRR
jgi:hypothetical protein